MTLQSSRTAFAAMSFVLSLYATLAPTAVHAQSCGAEGQNACPFWVRIPSCNPLLVESAGRCVHPPCGRAGSRACTVFERVPSCDSGLVERAGGCVLPTPCGAENQRPCTIWEHVPSCETNLVEQPLGVRCVHPVCGREGQRACLVSQRIPSCDSGLIEHGGLCVLPSGCGGEGERPCKLWERVPSCDPLLVEQPFGIMCVHPPCGREGMGACTIPERVPSCDRDLVEIAGRCVKPACGADGQRPCTVFERIPSCDALLVEQPFGVSCVHPACGRENERACGLFERIPSCDDELVESAGQCIAASPCELPEFQVAVPLPPEQEPGVRDAPFNLVVVGDSVAWGQGLNEGRKYYGIIAAWLKAKLDLEVNLIVTAHSGANILADAAGSGVATHPEIPNTYPTITEQVDIAAAALPGESTADLVLVSGCINDVGLTSVLNPTTPPAEIDATVSVRCGPDVADLIERIGRHPRFQQAQIVVTGYFAPISNDSDLTAIGMLLASAGVATASGLRALGVPRIDPLSGAIVGVGVTEVARRLAAMNSHAFLVASTRALARTVRESNESLPGRVRFACPAFRPEHAYAASESRLWLFPTGWASNDEVFLARGQACANDESLLAAGATVSSLGAKRTICRGASMGHPNLVGAQAYSEAIQAQLEPLMDHWRARFGR